MGTPFPTLTSDRLYALADYLEDDVLPDHFFMPSFKVDLESLLKYEHGNEGLVFVNPRPCGTAACVAGHAAMLWPEETDCNPEGFQHFMGVTPAESSDICYTWPHDTPNGADVKALKVRELRVLASHYQNLGK